MRKNISILKKISVSFSIITVVALAVSCYSKAFGSCQKPLQHIHSEYPKILQDRRVVFKLLAPDAEKVQVDFDKIYDMNKDADGSWNTTSDPQITGLHYYWYIIDGVRVSNPESEAFYNDRGQFMSGIEIVDEGINFDVIKNVPHGDIRTERYFSKTSNSWRQLNVYTPPGYDQNINMNYPVLYLQHGGGENEWGWVAQGRTNFIMDNLISEGKTVPMLVVMANGHVGRELNAGSGYSDDAMKIFSDEIINNVIPFVEMNYRVNTDKKSRALAGLSMGGGQSFYTGLKNLNIFGSVGVFSSGIFGGINGLNEKFNAEKQIPGILSDSKSFNEKLDIFYISVGTNDPRLEPTTDAVNIFRKNGLKLFFNTFPGGHEFCVWRNSLYDFAPKLFH